MTLQAKLNRQALDYFPKIKQLINNSADFEANQMRCNVIKQIMRLEEPIDKASPETIERYQFFMIQSFKYLGWV